MQQGVTGGIEVVCIVYVCIWVVWLLQTMQKPTFTMHVFNISYFIFQCKWEKGVERWGVQFLGADKPGATVSHFSLLL